MSELRIAGQKDVQNILMSARILREQGFLHSARHLEDYDKIVELVEDLHREGHRGETFDKLYKLLELHTRLSRAEELLKRSTRAFENLKEYRGLEDGQGLLIDIRAFLAGEEG